MQIDEISCHCDKQIFRFSIENFTQNTSEPVISSKEFDIIGVDEEKKTKWQLNVYPNGSNFLAKSISIFLKLVSSQPEKASILSFVLSVENQSTGETMLSKTMMGDFNQSKKENGFKCFIERKALFEKYRHLLEDNVLRIVLEVDVNFCKPVDFLENRLSLKMQDILTDGHFTDAVIKTNDKNLPIHRLYLAAKSRYFKELFCKNSDQREFQFEDVDDLTVEQVIMHVYDRNITDCPENPTKLMEAAIRFQLDDLKIFCTGKIIKVLAAKEIVEEIFDILRISLEHKLSDIFELAILKLRSNYETLCSYPNWSTLLKDQPRIIYEVLEESIIMENKQLSDEYVMVTNESEKNTPTKLCIDFEKLFLSEKHTDLTLEAEGKQIKVHKGIICSRSKVFDSMFNNNFNESFEDVVKIGDIEFDTLQELVRFIYSNKVDAEKLKEIAINLYSIADRYAVEELKILCENYLKENICVDNVVEVLNLADLHEAKELFLRAKYFFLGYIKQIPIDELTWMVSNDRSLTCLLDIFWEERTKIRDSSPC